MDVYVFEAALLCADCGESQAGADGPHGDGGGEADCPQHCDRCKTFLENPLTDDGRDYVRAALADGNGDKATLATWREFYSATL